MKPTKTILTLVFSKNSNTAPVKVSFPYRLVGWP